MAITIKRKEEKRNTPLLIFLSVAIIPLFLSYFAGFSSGRTEKADRKNWKEMYQLVYDSLSVAKRQLNALNEQVTAYNAVLNDTDSLVEKIQEDANEVLVELTNAYKAGPIIISTWRPYRNFLDTWSETILDLEKDIDKKSPIEGKKVIDLFEKLKEVLRDKINAKNELEFSQQAQEQKQALANQLQLIKDAEANLNKQEDISKKDRKIADLEEQLEACENKSSNASTDLNENKEHVSAIDAEVNAIRADILPEMKVGIFGNKKINKLREALRGRIDKISETTGKIN